MATKKKAKRQYKLISADGHLNEPGDLWTSRVPEKYKDQKGARETLARKVISGGTGVWGSYPMAPHPQHTIA